MGKFRRKNLDLCCARNNSSGSCPVCRFQARGGAHAEGIRTALGRGRTEASSKEKAL